MCTNQLSRPRNRDNYGLTSLIGIIVSHITKIEWQLDNRKAFCRDGEVSNESIPNQPVRIKVEHLYLHLVKLDRKIIGSGVDLECGEGREGEVGGVAGKFGRDRSVEVTSGGGEWLILVQGETRDTWYGKCEDDADPVEKMELVKREASSDAGVRTEHIERTGKIRGTVS
jgi:hypothetical protein